jgi:type I restriction enzyme, R subunit
LEVRDAFEPYYEATLLSEAADPNLLYDIQTRLAAFPIYTAAEVDGFAKVYFDPKATQDRLHAVLAPMVERFKALSDQERQDFRGQLTDYIRLYAFLSKVLTFADADPEKLYVFARYLRRLLPPDRAELPIEVQQNIDMESYRMQQIGSGRISIERKTGVLEPMRTKNHHHTAPEEMEALSRIISEPVPYL